MNVYKKEQEVTFIFLLLIFITIFDMLSHKDMDKHIALLEHYPGYVELSA